MKKVYYLIHFNVRKGSKVVFMELTLEQGRSFATLVETLYLCFNPFP